MTGIKPQLGVCYYPEHWQQSFWIEDARRMSELGISWVRIGEFAWSRLEPQQGEFDWHWLDQAIEILGSAGLQIVLGTPSATPPRWMLELYPDMLARDQQGNRRGFGSRRHYCFSHQGYRCEAARMAAAMAARYADDDSIHAWQIDNEYGCHQTTVSWSENARAGFRQWLERKYTTIDQLNHAWGNVFWSMEYSTFAQIDLPNLTVTEPNPSHQLDFHRYSSDMVHAFHRAQTEAIRQHSDKPIIHNFMGRITDFDHFAFGDTLDIASWDSYPLGFLEHIVDTDEDHKARYNQQGDPDFQAFHHDLYRAVGKGRWWVMEQQPGPVNWAAWNPTPADGMVRLWSWEAIAHGAEVVSYFRWRQAPFAQEQMHAALLRPDNQPAPAWHEVEQTLRETEQAGELRHQQSEVALLFDYQSQWAWQVQPQGQDFDYFSLVFAFYKALRSLGLSIDFVAADSDDFGTRKLVIIPGLMCWNQSLLKAIEQFKGAILAGPRSGSKTADMHIPKPLPPNMPGVDALVSRVASLRPNTTVDLERGGKAIKWFEQLESSEVLERSTAGEPVLAGNSHRAYLGCWPDAEAARRILADFCRQNDIATCPMPEGVRQRNIGTAKLITNYNLKPTDFQGHKIKGADCLFLR